ncbi:hypothetical protein QTV49_001700 [Vibrio vulnificus]|nr:hypothetical protein [Vibrio vulnificus]
MLSINEVIEKNTEGSGEPYFLLNSDEGSRQHRAIITNISKSQKLVSSPDSVSRVLIQQVNNLLCQFNMMQNHFDLSEVNAIHARYSRLYNAAHFINLRFGSISFLNTLIVDKIIIANSLSRIQILLKNDVEHVAKIQDHLEETRSLIASQMLELDSLLKKYEADSFEQKIAANKVISRIVGGMDSDQDDVNVVNSAFNLAVFAERLNDYILTQRHFYESLLIKIDAIYKCLVSISINSSSLVDVISSAIASNEKTFDISPTNSFEADLATYVRKTIRSELPLQILKELVDSHLRLVNESNLEIENIANDIDIESQSYSNGLIESIQPFVKNDLVKISAESMLNTQRKYEYDCEN